MGFLGITFFLGLQIFAGLAASIGDEDRARIIGGGPVHEGELKYQLSLRVRRAFSAHRGYQHACGASLAKVDGLQVAITAAHCLIRRTPEQMVLVAGTTTRNGTEDHHQTRQVVDFVQHDGFNLNFGPQNDIGIIFIDKPFAENEYVGPIALPKQGQETRGRVVLSGWGLHKTKVDPNEYELRPSPVLNKVEVPVLENKQCNTSYSKLLDEFSDHFMCTGFIEHWSSLYKGSCVGDSGGPVRSLENGYLAGVISFGKGCKDTSYPAVNMNVAHFRNWIDDEVKKFKNPSSSEEESKEDSSKSVLVKLS